MDPLVIFVAYFGLLIAGVACCSFGDDLDLPWLQKVGIALLGLFIFKLILIVILN